MKIRSGFVSNSSSSSFILRGIRTTREELIKSLNITQEEIDEYEEDGDYGFIELLNAKLNSGSRYGDIEKWRAKLGEITLKDYLEVSLDIEPTGNYFGNLDYNNLIIGKYLGTFEDGEVTEIGGSEGIDDLVISELSKIGLSGSLKTFVQMVSNDNY
jgi:hypothetical protein